MKNIQLIWRIALLICFLMGITIFIIDFSIERTDYSLVNRDTLKEFSTPWKISDEEGRSTTVTLPYILDSFQVRDVITFSNVIPDDLEGDSYIFFRARHQFIQTYINNELVYSYGIQDRRLFGKSPASSWILIPIDAYSAGDQIRIEFIPTYQKYSDHINMIYYGNRSAILYDLVVKRIPSIVMCIMLFMLGVGMILVSLVLGDASITKSLYRLGLLALVVSVWSTCIMNILQVIIGDPFALLNLEFLTFQLLLPVFLWFLLSFEYYNSKKMIHILYIASIILFIIIELLQITDIADYMITIFYTHILMTISLVYLTFIGIKALFLKHAPEEVKMFTISMLVLVAFLVMDLVMFYVHTSLDEGFYSRIGTLVFIGLWTVDIIRSISNMMVRIAKTEIFEQLAFQDQLTGIANRRSFESELDNYRSKNRKDDLYLIAFDLNNLKVVNDNFGHENGDFAIKTVATAMQKAFDKIGSCYRIGGDEFFALIPIKENILISDLKDKLEVIADEIVHSGRSKQLDFSVASGIAKLSENNFDIDATFRAADGMMYENKARMKKQ